MCFLTHKAVGWECPGYCFFFYGIWFFFEGKHGCTRNEPYARQDARAHQQALSGNHGA